MTKDQVKRLVLAGKKITAKNGVAIRLNAETQEVELLNSPQGDIACPVSQMKRALRDFERWGREAQEYNPQGSWSIFERELEEFVRKVNNTSMRSVDSDSVQFEDDAGQEKLKENKKKFQGIMNKIYKTLQQMDEHVEEIKRI